MKVLVVFNTIVNLVVLCVFLKDRVYCKYEFKFYNTFWQKKPFGFYILLWNRPRWVCPNSGRTIFSFRWVSEKWLSDSLEGKRKDGEKTSIISAFSEGWTVKFKELWEDLLDDSLL